MVATFGIPEGEANLDLLAQQVQSNGSQIAQIAKPIGESLFSQLTSNQKQLDGVWRKLRNGLRGRITSNKGQLEQIAATLQNSLAAIAARRQGELAHLSLTTKGQGLSCPPGELLIGQIPAGASATGQAVPLCGPVETITNQPPITDIGNGCT